MISAVNTHFRATSQTRNNRFEIPRANMPSNMTTSGQSSKTREELKARIMEIAKADFESGEWTNWDEFTRGNRMTEGRHHDEFNQLMSDWISFDSPDRAAIVQRTAGSFASKMTPAQQNQLSSARNFLQMLIDTFGNHRNPNNRDIGPNFMNFRDSNGALIGSYTSGQGWSDHQTDAENAARIEFKEIWRQTFSAVGSANAATDTVIDLKASGFQLDLSAKIANGSSFNMDRLNQAGIHINAETGETYLTGDMLEKSNAARLQYHANQANQATPPQGHHTLFTAGAPTSISFSLARGDIQMTEQEMQAFRDNNLQELLEKAAQQNMNRYDPGHAGEPLHNIQA